MPRLDLSQQIRHDRHQVVTSRFNDIDNTICVTREGRRARGFSWSQSTRTMEREIWLASNVGQEQSRNEKFDRQPSDPTLWLALGPLLPIHLMDYRCEDVRKKLASWEATLIQLDRPGLVLSDSLRKPQSPSQKKWTVQPQDAFEDTAFEPRFEIVKF